MVRVQVQFTEDQSARLKEMARQERVSVAEVVRRCVDEETERKSVLTFREKIRRAREVFGKYSGPTDMAAEHDRYFAESLRHK